MSEHPIGSFPWFSENSMKQSHEPPPTFRENFKPIYVKGCGVSFLCSTRKAVLEAVSDILDRGGWPSFESYVAEP